ncbi:hypothetical protein ACHAXH_004302 [Discostella pseudostelligera]
MKFSSATTSTFLFGLGAVIMSIGAAADGNDKHRELQSSPTYYPTYAPNESSMVDASATTATGATMSTNPGGGVSSVEMESWMVCPEYSDTPTQLNMDQLTFYHSVALAPEGDSRIGLLCGKLERNDGSTGGYIGFGISPDGEMSDSVGIVGLPDSGTVEKYWLMDGYVERMSDDKQTLLYTTIGQDEDGTPYMEFAKFLYEEEELPIVANGDNTFLFALGESSELAYHSAGEGAFTLDLETPSNATTTSDATVTGATSTLTASTTFSIEATATPPSNEETNPATTAAPMEFQPTSTDKSSASIGRSIYKMSLASVALVLIKF